MPKTLMQSVVSELQKERTRLADELHRVTAALTAFGKVYMQASTIRCRCIQHTIYRRR